MGGIVQPLFSAFGEDVAADAARRTRARPPIVTQRKHLGEGAPDPRAAARAAARHRRRRRPALSLREGELALDLDAEPAGGDVRVLPGRPRDAVGPALHLGHHRPAEGRPARARLARRAVPDGEVGARPAAGRRLLVQRRPRLGDRHVLRDHRPLVERRDPGGARLRLQRRALVRLHREAPRHGLVLGADRDPPADARGRRSSRGSTTSSLAAAPGSVGEPLNPEAVLWSQRGVRAGRSTTPSGRPRPAAS